MAGLNLQTGLTGSAVGSLYNGSSSAGAPTRTAVPEGPMTVAQAAYGGPGGSRAVGTHAVLVGVIAAGILLFMWWGLPRLGRSHRCVSGSGAVSWSAWRASMCTTATSTRCLARRAEGHVC